MRIGIIVNWSRKGAESNSVLELTRWLRYVMGRLELWKGHLGVVPVEVVAAPGIPVKNKITLHSLLNGLLFGIVPMRINLDCKLHMGYVIPFYFAPLKSSCRC